MSDVVLLELRDAVALLTLNRPDRLNAWTPELQSRLFDLLDECAADERVRAIVITGAGRGFCAGADMEALQALSAGEHQNGSETAAPTNDRSVTRCRSPSRSSGRSMVPARASAWRWR